MKRSEYSVRYRYVYVLKKFTRHMEVVSVRERNPNMVRNTRKFEDADVVTLEDLQRMNQRIEQIIRRVEIRRLQRTNQMKINREAREAAQIWMASA